MLADVDRTDVGGSVLVARGMGGRGPFLAPTLRAANGPAHSSPDRRP
jgi:hypothetical protein